MDEIWVEAIAEHLREQAEQLEGRKRMTADAVALAREVVARAREARVKAAAMRQALGRCRSAGVRRLIP